MGEAEQTRDFGALVRALREDRLLTRGELAERSGLSLATLEKVEGGSVRRPRLTTIRALAKGLGVDAHVLLGRERVLPKAEAPAAEDALPGLDGLSPEAAATAANLSGDWGPGETVADLERLRDELSEHAGTDPARFAAFVAGTPPEDLARLLWPGEDEPELQAARARTVRDAARGLRAKLDEALDPDRIAQARP